MMSMTTRAALFVAPRDVEERRVAQTFRHSGRGQRQVTQVVLAFPRAVPAVQARVRGLVAAALPVHSAVVPLARARSIGALK